MKRVQYLRYGAPEELRLDEAPPPEAGRGQIRVQVKAAGGIRDLDALIKVRDLGASRCGASATAAMLDEYRRREAAEKSGQTDQPRSTTIGSGGY